MNHSIPQPPDEEPANQRKPLVSEIERGAPSPEKLAAEAAFYTWLTPERIERYNGQHVVFTPKGRHIATGSDALMARENASGYGYNNAFIFQVYPGLLREIGCEQPQGVIARIKKKLRNFLP